MNNLLALESANHGAGETNQAVSALKGSVEDFSKRDLMVSNVLGDQEAIDDLGRGSTLPQKKLMELRSKGMQAVRFEFIVRLMRLKIEIYTLSIYWEDGYNFMRLPTLQKGICKLVYASAARVSGEFGDISLLRYPHDLRVKAELDAELDSMVAIIGNLLAVPE